nr:hypothetical protein [Tanacetum cinerariifolium]
LISAKEDEEVVKYNKEEGDEKEESKIEEMEVVEKKAIARRRHRPEKEATEKKKEPTTPIAKEFITEKGCGTALKDVRNALLMLSSGTMARSVQAQARKAHPLLVLHLLKSHQRYESAGTSKAYSMSFSSTVRSSKVRF